MLLTSWLKRLPACSRRRSSRRELSRSSARSAVTLTGDLTVTAKTVTLNNGTVSSDATVTINADEAITNADTDLTHVAIAAVDLVMTTTGTGSAIGTVDQPITTSLGSLTAVTNDG